MFRILNSIFIFPLIFTLRIYQIFLSPVLPRSCRFYPTCSRYAITALREHKLIKGSWLTLKRIIRCRPGVSGGFDPVPSYSERGSKWKRIS